MAGYNGAGVVDGGGAAYDFEVRLVVDDGGQMIANVLVTVGYDNTDHGDVFTIDEAEPLLPLRPVMDPRCA